MTPRTSKNPDKIKDVELVNGRWVYRPLVPKEKRSYIRHDRRGRLAPPIKLGIKDDPWHRIVTQHAKEYERFMSDVDREKFTLLWIWNQYRESSRFDELAKGTQSKAVTNSRILKHPIRIGGRPDTLGSLRVEEINHPMIYKIREKRLKDLQANGSDGKSQCNREIAFLSAIVTWARRYYMQVSVNPFRGIEALKENANDRYVTHDEYWAQYEISHEISDYLPVVFEGVYLLATRGVEITDILLTDIQDKIAADGTTQRVIRVRRRKGSKTTDIIITPRHQAFIDSCMKLHSKRPVSGKYLLPGMRGERMNKGTIDSAMQDLKRLMKDRGMTTCITRLESQDTDPSDLFWSLHLLKAKGVTDALDKGIAGHRTEAMKDRYTRQTGTFSGPVQPHSPKRSPHGNVTRIPRSHK